MGTQHPTQLRASWIPSPGKEVVRTAYSVHGTNTQPYLIICILHNEMAKIMFQHSQKKVV